MLLASMTVIWSLLISPQLQKFAEELRWCIGQLELGLQRQSPDSRQGMDEAYSQVLIMPWECQLL